MHEARDESKSEEDEPPSAVARQEAGSEADRIAMTLPKVLSKGATIPMSAIAPTVINQGGDDAVSSNDSLGRATQTQSQRSWTRLARRQAEAQAAAAAPTGAIPETTNEFAEVSKNGKDEHQRQYEEHARGGTDPVADAQSVGHATKNTARTKDGEPMDVTPMPGSNKKHGRKQSPTIASAQLGTDEMTDEETQETPSTLQLTDTEIVAAQQKSRLVPKMLEAGSHQDMPVDKMFGLAVTNTARGKRAILPPTLWPIALKDMHGSIWTGHMRGPHTYGSVARLYWCPDLHREVNDWVRGCQGCGSRKARTSEVIPPLRSLGGGAVGDRWALDVAGPFPRADGGERYVIATLEYVTRYAVVRGVTQHTAERVATFLMDDMVLRFGAFRESLTDGAPELTGRGIEQLVTILQAKQTNPVPYRPQMIGLVERFYRSWKDCVSTFKSNEKPNDWSEWAQCEVYAYNSAPHSTVALSPNVLMMGRRLRPPNELLRLIKGSEAGGLMAYHEQLLGALARGHRCAERARQKEQARQARYYDKNVRRRRTFEMGDKVWVYNPPRGPKANEFVHQWMGPMRVVEPAGYENFVLKREDKNGAPELMIAHASFLVSYQSSTSILRRIAGDINQQLEHEDKSVRASMSRRQERLYSQKRLVRALAGVANRRRDAAADAGLVDDTLPKLVELRWRNRAGGGNLRRAGWMAPSTIDCIVPAGSWKTSALRMSCNLGLVTSASRTADGQAVGDHDGCKTWYGEMRAEATGRAWNDRDKNEVTVTPSSELTGSHGG
ncbi:unnamed protein product [Phytophthora fragariaefolia]|uniref:Unnamed protein product n=1 Tax=Phytophthora fragariaefolia TaxID=1490495 RepID=A0A9W7CT87_9STRA|nr:unnamed protein product [Phytophthora fragariaefolia]